MYRTLRLTRDEALYLIHKRFGVALLKQDRAKMFAGLRSMGFAIVPLEPTDAMIRASQDLMPMVGSPARLADAGAQAIHNNATHRHAVNHYRAMIAAYEKEQGDG